MAPCIRPRFDAVQAELATDSPLSAPLVGFDLHDHKDDINKEDDHCNSPQNKDKISEEIHGHLRQVDRKKKHPHCTDLNKNKHFVNESKGLGGVDYTKSENFASSRKYYASSSSLDYFARLSNPKTGQFRHYKAEPKRIHSRQLPLFSGIDPLSQSLIATSIKPKKDPLEATEQLLDSHTHHINHMPLISRLYLFGSKRSSPTTGRIVDPSSGPAFTWSEASAHNMTAHDQTNIFSAQNYIGEIEASTGTTRWSDTPRLAEHTTFPIADFVRRAHPFLPLLLLAISLALLWRALKSCSDCSERNRREAEIQRLIEIWRNNYMMIDGMYMDGFEMEKLLPLEELNGEAMEESDGASVREHGLW